MKRLQGIVIGILISAMLSGIVAYAAPGTIEVLFDNIKIKINGSEIKSDTEPFTYNDRTYVPLRAVAENMGADVYWDDATKTVSIYDSRNEKLLDYYDAVFLMGQSSTLNELNDTLMVCRDRVWYENRGTEEYNGWYEVFKVKRNAFNDAKTEMISMANTIKENSSCTEIIAAANMLLDIITRLDENIDLLSDLYVSYDSNKDLKLAENLGDIKANNREIQNVIYAFANN